MTCWHRLNFSLKDAVKPDFVKFTGHGDESKVLVDLVQCIVPQFYMMKDVLSPEWITSFQDTFDLQEDMQVVTFYLPPYHNFTHAHVDMSAGGINCHAALNFVLGHDPRDMIWYDPNLAKKYGKPWTHQPTQVYTTFPDQIIDRVRIGNHLTLVRTDVPHMMGGRYVASDRFSISIRNRFLTYTPWEDLVRYFTPWMPL